MGERAIGRVKFVEDMKMVNISRPEKTILI